MLAKFNSFPFCSTLGNFTTLTLLAAFASRNLLRLHVCQTTLSWFFSFLILSWPLFVLEICPAVILVLWHKLHLSNLSQLSWDNLWPCQSNCLLSLLVFYISAVLPSKIESAIFLVYYMTSKICKLLWHAGPLTIMPQSTYPASDPGTFLPIAFAMNFKHF